MNRIRNQTACLALLLVIGTGLLQAQSSGKITGTVRDAISGDPLAGAIVIVEGTSLGAAADADGYFLVVRVPSGAYSVSASYLGYRKMIQQNVRVLTDLTTELSFSLNEEAIQGEEVIVTAETPMIRKDLTATESRVTSDEIENLPLQNIEQLITLQAGVTKDAGGGIHIRGGRSSEVAYLVNGISVTDDFSRSQAVNVETESIQELQIISGTFNAEYGNAMSGVVNVVTRSGTRDFRASVEAWAGDYVSGNKAIFWGIDEVRPFANHNVIATVSGPIIGDQMTFFTSFRRSYDGGYLNGIRAYAPQGRQIPGDSAIVSMSSFGRWSGQATVDWQMGGDIRLKVDALGSRDEGRSYSHFNRLNPDGVGSSKSEGGSIIARLTHRLHETTFHDITFALRANGTRFRLYDDPYDARYVHPDSQNVPGYHFAVAGTNLNRFQRSTRSFIGKYDITSQLTRQHLVKAGVEVQSDKVFYESITLTPARDARGQQVVPFVPFIEGIDNPNHDEFTRTPFKAAAYIQDKIELESMIINAGIRVEVFDPQGRIPVDQEDPNIYSPFKLEHLYHDLNGDGEIGLDEQVPSNAMTVAQREAFWYRSIGTKMSVSPRLGIAYPITDQGIIRFSYGIFQQIPEYSQLYLGDQFKLTSAQGVQGPFGNNDLDPQRTTIYELGLQQQLTDVFAVDVTAFYRDIRDWISSSRPIPTFLAGISYSQRINRDFANIRGITLSLTRRHADGFSFGFDYTFQVAEGTNSTPDEEFFAQQGGAEPTRTLTPLGWDQEHTFNANLFVGSSEFGGSLIVTASTGQPYTPTLIGGSYTGRNVITGLAENSRRKPFLATFDLELFRTFSFGGLDVQAFVRIFNLFDARNPTTVYGDTGKPDQTLQKQQVSEYDEGWFDVPTYYSPPRSIYAGTRISL